MVRQVYHTGPMLYPKYLRCSGVWVNPIRFILMDKVYGLAMRLLNLKSDLVQEALQVLEGQGEANLFYRQVEELLTLLDSEANYRAYREEQLRLYVSQELLDVN